MADRHAIYYGAKLVREIDDAERRRLIQRSIDGVTQRQLSRMHQIPLGQVAAIIREAREERIDG